MTFPAYGGRTCDTSSETKKTSRPVEIIPTEYLATLRTCFKSKSLELTFEKLTATVFTTWTLEVNTTLDIHIAGHTIPTVTKPKILRVTLDNMLTFPTQALQICGKLQSRNNVLAGTNWCKDKDNVQSNWPVNHQLRSPLLDTTNLRNILD